jgi:hypothetical protein
LELPRNPRLFAAPAILFPDLLPLHVDKVQSFQDKKGCSFYTLKKHWGGHLQQQVVAAAQEYSDELEQACCDKNLIILKLVCAVP